MPDTAQLHKRAEESFNKRQYDYARDLYLQVLLLDPDDAHARMALKATLMKKFQEQGATGKITVMGKKAQLEVQLKATKDLAKKIEICQSYLSIDPNNSKVRTVLAEALLALGHSNGAAAEAEMAIKDDRANVSAAKTLVSAYINVNKLKEAEQILMTIQSTVKEDRDLEKFQRDLAARQTMKAGFEDGGGKAADYRNVIKNSGEAANLEADKRLIQTDAALVKKVEELKAEMAGAPTDARIPKRIGDLYFEIKKDYTSARDWYKKASQLAPQDSVLRDKVDDCALRLFDQQVEAAKKSGDPKLKEIQLNQLKFTIQSFERRVQDRPTDMGLRFELGKAYYIGSMIDKAIGEFQQSVKDPKKKADSQFFLGKAFQKKKMFDMADKQYAMAVDGVLSQDRRLEILYNRAVCNHEAGKKDQAITLGKEIMEIDISYKDVSALVDRWVGESSTGTPSV
ncbi:MAG TPA: tetratricopeptide repeat protein [Planctomycetota bacterium]|nr:tetratricopeptide repeat protein [Planctomycetota bacterium]